jgi:signal transduction histidine kinase
MSSASGSKDPTGNWESFLRLWERANLIRSFFWKHQGLGERTLLGHFLVRMRRFFGVDFCFGVLIISDNGEKIVEVGIPEAAVGRLPTNFSRRCLDLVANSRAPITWNEVSGEFGFRSTVVAPLTSPVGRPFGFLMLGHSSRKNYSSAELFLLQALAGELSWAVRDLASKKQHQRQIAAMFHDVKNALQVIVGNTALIRQKLGDAPVGEQEKRVHTIESSVQEILDRINVVSDCSSEGDDESEASEATVVNIANAVEEAVTSCRRASRDRGVDLEVRYGPKSPGEATTDPAMFKQLLGILIDNAALATRNETVRLTVRRDAASLELIIKGMGTSRAAEKLKSLFETATHSDGVRDENGEGVIRVREYLENAGGDVYLRGRPGQAAEFVVILPIENSDRTVQPVLENHLRT